MKKMLDLSFGYALAALAGGVFYREFTRLNGFTGRTALGLVHTHLFLLGCGLFLVLAALCARLPVREQKPYRLFFRLYNAGLPLTAAALLARGVLQVLGTPLSSAADAALSGAAGGGHILLGAGLVLLFVCLRRAAAAVEEKSFS